MPNAVSGGGFSASAAIRTARFVKLDATVGYDFMVKECAAAADMPIGISQDGSNAPPGLVAALSGVPETLYAAGPYQQLTVFMDGDQCKLVVGAGGCATGDKLASDANGQGVTVTSGHFGAVAKSAALAGELVDVIVQPGTA